MKYTIKLLLMAVLITAFVSACDTSDDPSLTRVNMEIKAVTSQGTINRTGRVASVSQLTFQEFMVGVTELEFEKDDDSEGDDDDDEIEFEGSYVVDVLSGTSSPDFGLASLEPGIYEEIEMEMKPILSGNHTISIKASYDESGTPVPVEFTTGKTFELEIEDDDGIDLTQGILQTILITIDIDILFSGIDLANATRNENGAIIISDNSNEALQNKIENNLSQAFDADDDDDDDDDNDDDDDDD